MQTLRACCNKAEPKIFILPQTPFQGMQEGLNLISWRWTLPLPTNPVWWWSMHAISSYCGNRPTHTQERLQYTALQLARSVIKQTVKSGQSYTTSIFTNICQTLIQKHSSVVSVHFLVKIASQ